MVGTVIDAMDLSGRWYQAEITDIDTSSKQDTDMETDDDTVASETEEEKRFSVRLTGEIRVLK